MCEDSTLVMNQFKNINTNFGSGSTLDTDYGCLLLSNEDYVFYVRMTGGYRCIDSSDRWFNLAKIFNENAPETLCSGTLLP